MSRNSNDFIMKEVGGKPLLGAHSEDEGEGYKIESNSQKNGHLSQGKMFSPKSPHPLSHVLGDKGTSMQSTIFNLVNTTIGAGLLCLPYAMQLDGMVTGAVILCIIAWAAGKSANMLAVCLDHTGAPSYGDLAMSVWGQRGKRIVELTNCTCSFGMMCGYSCIIGDILAPVFVNLLNGPPPAALTRGPLIAIMSTCILLPLSSLEHMSSLAASSYFAFAFVVFFVICVTIKTLVLSPFPEFTADYRGSTPKAVFFRYDIVAYLRSAPIVFTAFLNHMNVPILFNDLSAVKLPSEPNCFHRVGSKLARMAMATRIALLIVLVLSIIVGEFGYIYFRNNTTSNVLKDYEPSKLIDVMRVAYALVLSTCFPLQGIVYSMLHPFNIPYTAPFTTWQSLTTFPHMCPLIRSICILSSLWLSQGSSPHDLRQGCRGDHSAPLG
jgi:sodium-coupled neutral amino acid transporter 11